MFSPTSKRIALLGGVFTLCGWAFFFLLGELLDFLARRFSADPDPLGPSTGTCVAVAGFYVSPLLSIFIAALYADKGPSRFPAGHCRECGYNLTGNVSGRCPECGEPV